MLNRISVNALLKSVIATLGAAVVIMLGISAWGSWTRLVAVNQIAAVADVSSNIFTSLHNLRSDRSRSYRMVIGEEQAPSRDPRLWESRDAELPALKAALAGLENVKFPEQKAVLTEFEQRFKKLQALHAESADAVAKPKAQRRQDLGPEINTELTALIEFLDKLSLRLNKLVKLEDALIDQFMELKQLGWVARDAGGEASVMVSNGLSGQPLGAEPMVKYNANLAKLMTAWALLKEQASGLPLTQKFNDAVAKVDREYF